MNSQEAFLYLTSKLEKQYNNKVQAEQYARWTLESITQKEFAQLVAHPISIDTFKTKIDYWLTQLVEHEEPIQYLIGRVPFGIIEIITKHPVLIPRPETEEWVISLAAKIKNLIGTKQSLKILDACTGSGCIALLLGSLLPNAQILGIDNADHAIELAQTNKAHLAISNVSFLKADITDYQPDGLFDLIVANPPYIDHDDWLTLSPSVTAWEDYHALVADDNGYSLIQTIINRIPYLLKKNSDLAQSNIPHVVIEIGHTQGERTLEIVEKSSTLAHAKINKDYAGNDRVLYAFGRKKD